MRVRHIAADFPDCQQISGTWVNIGADRLIWRRLAYWPPSWIVSRLVREDVDDIGAPLDLSIKPFQRIGTMDLQSIRVLLSNVKARRAFATSRLTTPIVAFS